MKFDDELEMYVYQCKGIIFAWEDEPEDDYKATVKPIAESYHSHFDALVAHMLPELQEFFGDVTAEEVKEKLGIPTYCVDDGRLSYFEQTLDDCHLIEVEILDENFEKLGYVSIDG